jgi:hypothetical protein
MGLYKEVFEDVEPDFTVFQDQIADLKLEVHRLSQDRLMAIAIIKEYKSRLAELGEHVELKTRDWRLKKDR